MARMKVWLGVAASLVLTSSNVAAEPKPPGLEAAYQAIHAARFVDLTHTFSPSTPHWPGFPTETAKTIYNEKKDGFTAQLFTHVGQWGTHVDAPAHFHERLHTVDQIDPKEFLLRLVVFDVHDKVKANPDYVLSMDDVCAWERRHGPVPRGAFAVMRTDWAKRWPSEAAMQNKDAKGVAHFPGWSKPVMQYLYEQRGIVASGHETSDTGPGVIAGKGDFSLESYILGLNHFQIEFLTNLDQVPEAGALVMVTFPKPEHGSGFPARVVAIVP